MNRRIQIEVLPNAGGYLISTNFPDGRVIGEMHARSVESGRGDAIEVVQLLTHPDDEDPFQYGMRTLRWQPDRKSALQRDPKQASEDDIPF